MIFGLHPAFGFIPLLVYIIFSFKGKDVTLVLIISSIIGAILTGTGLVDYGKAIAGGVASFLGMIGFMIMLGSGLGQLLTETKVVHYIVNAIMTKLHVNSIRKAVIGVMFSSTLIVGLLGSMAGGNAIIAPIIIPTVAALGMTPSTLGVLLHGAGAIGLICGPFVPFVVSVLGIINITYGEYLLTTGIPISVIIAVATYFISFKIQKDTAGKFAYSPEDIITNEDTSYLTDSKVKRSTIVAGVTLVAMLIYGIIVKASAQYVITVMLLVSFLTGWSAGLNMEQTLKQIVNGAQRMFWIFLMFVFFDPTLNFITKSGAFTWLGDLITPYIQSSNKGIFFFVSSLIGFLGIPGATVAQIKIINDLFGTMAASMGIPLKFWALAVTLGCQLDFFAFPTIDIVSQMGLARSNDLASMMKQGWLITGLLLIYLLVISILIQFGVI